MSRAFARSLLRRAVHSIRANTLRSGLSIVGVVFGVASITAMSSVTEGARREAVAQIGDLGADTLVVRIRVSSNDQDLPELTIDDARHLAVAVPGVLALVPIRESSVEVSGPNGMVLGSLVGATEKYSAASRGVLALGRSLASIDVTTRRRVAVIGAGIARRLFPGTSPLGQAIQIDGDLFDVVGVFEPRATPKSGRSSPLPVMGRDLNRAIVVPWNTVPNYKGSAHAIDEVLIRARDPREVRSLAGVVRRGLEQRLGRSAVEVVVPLEVLRQQQRTQKVFSAVTGTTSLICLVVGGVGIMNILLASVSERVREIGIRRAVGATQEDIALHFLAEGGLLSASGGVMGLVLGGIASLVLQRWAAWPVAAAPPVVFLGLISSVATGLAAAGYPAWKASRLEVMEALRQG